MWVKLDSNDNVIAEYVRPQPLTIGDVQYPASIFRNRLKLFFWGILPVQRVQVNSPEDTTGWVSSFVYAPQFDFVEKRVTWVKRPDFDEIVAARDVELARVELLRKAASLRAWMAINGFYTVSTMLPTDFADFEADYADESLASLP